MKRQQIYQMVTDRIIEQLQKGVVPWKKSWNVPGGTPKNLITGKPYRGVNRLLLATFTNPYFVTFRQAKQLGGTVKRGEKATPIVFWKVTKEEVIDEETNETSIKTSFVLRYYSVFSVEQCENLSHKRLEELKKIQEEKREVFPIEAAEAIVQGYTAGPEIRHGKSEAYYSPIGDYIGMPERVYFEDDEKYFSVLFHEQIHSTGVRHRLNRFEGEEKNVAHKDAYGKEELVAEMGAGFLCGMAGIEHTEPCASYLKSWIDILKGDTSLLVKAGSQAQKATDYILGKEHAE